MEGKASLGLKDPDLLAGVAIEDEDSGSTLGLPAEVLDERPSAQRNRDRVYDERKLGQRDVALAHRKGMHVARFPDRLRRQDARRSAWLLDEEAVCVARSHA